MLYFYTKRGLYIKRYDVVVVVVVFVVVRQCMCWSAAL